MPIIYHPPMTGLYDIPAENLAKIEWRKVNWYQADILHLFVPEHMRRQGIGMMLVQQAEQAATASNCTWIQGTIEADNWPSRRLFGMAGYWVIGSFTNPATGHAIVLIAKQLSPAAIRQCATGSHDSDTLVRDGLARPGAADVTASVTDVTERVHES